MFENKPIYISYKQAFLCLFKKLGLPVYAKTLEEWETKSPAEKAAMLREDIEYQTNRMIKYFVIRDLMRIIVPIFLFSFIFLNLVLFKTIALIIASGFLLLVIYRNIQKEIRWANVERALSEQMLIDLLKDF